MASVDPVDLVLYALAVVCAIGWWRALRQRPLRLPLILEIRNVTEGEPGPSASERILAAIAKYAAQ